MAEIFPEWTNKAPAYLLIALTVLALATVGGVWYFFSPQFTDVGYEPIQPVPFSHKLHVGRLQIDCRYCHAQVEVSAVATVPPTQTCLNCHRVVARESALLEPIRVSFEKSRPMRWVRVHQLPQYAYFSHVAHISAGVGCSTCHGNVAEMDLIRQVAPLSMGWCLDCHRNPDPFLRPPSQVTDPYWAAPPDQLQVAAKLKETHAVEPPTDCTGCHR